MKSIEYLTQNYATKKLGNDILHGCILELDAKVKELEERFNEHVGYWPENDTKPTHIKDEKYDMIWKKPTPTDDINKPPEEAVRKWMMLPDTKSTSTDEELVDKYCTLIYSNLSLTLSDLAIIRVCLIQLLTEVKK